jgi:hypothetical protein
VAGAFGSACCLAVVVQCTNLQPGTLVAATHPSQRPPQSRTPGTPHAESDFEPPRPCVQAPSFDGSTRHAGAHSAWRHARTPAPLPRGPRTSCRPALASSAITDGTTRHIRARPAWSKEEQATPIEPVPTASRRLQLARPCVQHHHRWLDPAMPTPCRWAHRIRLQRYAADAPQ